MLTLSKNQIKFIKSLHQKKNRQEYRMFLLEGEKLVNEALRDKPEIIEFLVVQNNYESFASLQKISSPVFCTNNSVFSDISTFVTPPPILAVCRFLDNSCSETVNLKNTFSFYLDKINDPGNFGTILRIADWFGIDELFCSPDTVELYNPKTIQASKGSFLRVKVNYVAFDKLKMSENTLIYGADLSGQSIHSISKKNGLIILGNESHGISKELKKRIHQFICIPKNKISRAESLNVAMSAAIIAYEFSN